MRVLIAASGSYGDVYPFVGLGRELRLHGHRIVFFANEHFRAAAEAEHLEFVAVGSSADYDHVVHDPQLWHARRGLKVVLDAVMRFTPLGYERLLANYHAGQTLLVASSLAFSARLLQETHGAPLASVHLSPSVFRSALDPINMPNLSIPAAAPAWVKSILWWSIDRFALDPLVTPPMNAYRLALGLPPIRRLFDQWLHSPNCVIGLFPRWFATPRDDWPPQTRLTGFPLYDAAAHEPSPAGLQQFLSAGSPPVLFAPGTANVSARAFFEASLSACKKAGKRAVLVTRYEDHVPRPLPDWAAHFDYVPFSTLLPQCCAFVSHGGIGSLSQGLRAGVPQLIRPMAFDQFDNGRRAEQLGVARVIAPSDYRPHAIAQALAEIDSDARAESCRQAAEHCRGDEALVETAAMINALGAEALRNP